MAGALRIAVRQSYSLSQGLLGGADGFEFFRGGGWGNGILPPGRNKVESLMRTGESLMRGGGEKRLSFVARAAGAGTGSVSTIKSPMSATGPSAR